jgi:hypothetical protein
VKLEQASNVKLWMSTRLSNREGRAEVGRNDTHLYWSMGSSDLIARSPRLSLSLFWARGNRGLDNQQ